VEYPHWNIRQITDVSGDHTTTPKIKTCHGHDSSGHIRVGQRKMPRACTTRLAPKTPPGLVSSYPRRGYGKCSLAVAACLVASGRRS
jgi:hypothetical protein